MSGLIWVQAISKKISADDKIVTVKRVHMKLHLIPLYNYMIRVAYQRQKSVLEHIPHNYGVFTY